MRRFHQPEWMPDRLFIDKETLFGPGYASVVPAPGGGFYLYYTTCLAGGENPEDSAVLCLATGADGLQWDKINLNPPRKPGYPQVVYPGDPVPVGCHVYYDPADPDASRRYKMTECVQIAPYSCRMLYSPDGLEWRVDRDHPFLNRHSDTMLYLLRNHRTGRYQITLRRFCCERRVFLTESEDLEHWTEPRLAIHGSPIDPPMMQFYGMPQFRYADMFIGFLWRYQTTYEDTGPWKSAGTIETELAASYDGLCWNRQLRPFMPVLERGVYGGGSIYGTALLEREEDILVYAIASLEEHHHFRIKSGDPQRTGILPGRLRKDGFVSLASFAGQGELTTDGLYLRSPELRLNVKAPLGGVRVQICDMNCTPLPGYTFDECAEIRGDSLAAAPAWQKHRDLAQAIESLRGNGWLAGWARLQIQLDQAELFAISGDFGIASQSGAPGQDYL